MDATGEMRAFVTVVEHQGFAAAAATLGLSPSAVSKLVTRLEDRLGVQLLHRTTRRLSLSSEGDVYLARARQILADIAEAEIEVTRSRGAPRGRLRITPATVSVFTSWRRRCRSSWPAIRTSRLTSRSPIASSTSAPIRPM